ncbi:unnamed protein product [Prorocentrum cordatum]|uniref:C3H1-type domain-containing protein n=1 Tax=Prorocentrum cordatum TaxID=2364126 RepID=A0ABN9Y415_9DINO|nr:unnamed protein product [Polarella glacialis]
MPAAAGAADARPTPGSGSPVCPEVDQGGDGTSSSWSTAILKNMKIRPERSSDIMIRPEYSSSCQPCTPPTWAGDTSDLVSSVDDSSLRTLENARPPQARGDAGLDIDSDGDAAPSKGDASEHAARYEDARPCYDLWLHDAGLCRPCSTIFKKAGCVRGDCCEFCHFPHMVLKRARPSKVRRRVSSRLTPALAAGEGRPPEEEAMMLGGVGCDVDQEEPEEMHFGGGGGAARATGARGSLPTPQVLHCARDPAPPPGSRHRSWRQRSAPPSGGPEAGQQGPLPSAVPIRSDALRLRSSSGPTWTDVSTASLCSPARPICAAPAPCGCGPVRRRLRSEPASRFDADGSWRAVPRWRT